jgi:hypothetical protein
MKRDYKDLMVWQKGIELVTEVYKATDNRQPTTDNRFGGT